MLKKQRGRLTRKVCAVAVGMYLGVGAASLPAQDGRKLISHPAPVYPQEAKRYSIAGVVKMQVVIAADGHIKETKVVGGHPMLVLAAQEAVKNWQYAPANGETTTVIEFNFHP